MLGELLIQDGAITPKALEEVLAEQRRLTEAGQRVLLGELLVRSGRITEAQLSRALERRALR